MLLTHLFFDEEREYPKNLYVIVNAPEYPNYHNCKMLVMWISVSINRINEKKKMYHLAFSGSSSWQMGICQIYLGESQIKFVS
jgi:hypothetical protein